MRVVRFAIDDLPKFGVLEDGSDSIVVLKSDPLFDKIEPAGQVLDLSEVRLLSPVIPRSKVVGAKLGEENKPAFFIKPNTAVVGPDVAVVKPDYAEKVYANANIGVVIKNLCKNVEVENISKYILGYTVVNDVTVKTQEIYPNDDFYTKGFDTSCVVGPWIIVDPEFEKNHLSLRTYLGKNLVSTQNIEDFSKEVLQVVSKASKIATLLPGDIVMVSYEENTSEVELEQMMRIDIDGVGSISNMLVEEEVD